MMNQEHRLPPLPIPAKDAWFVHREGVLSGPHFWTEEQINHSISSGLILPNDLLWRDGFDNWFHAGYFNHPYIQDRRRSLNNHIYNYNPALTNPHAEFEKKVGRSYIPSWDNYQSRVRWIRAIGVNIWLLAIAVFAWFGYEQIGLWALLICMFMFLPGAYLIVMPLMGFWLAYEGSWSPLILFVLTYLWTTKVQVPAMRGDG